MMHIRKTIHSKEYWAVDKKGITPLDLALMRKYNKKGKQKRSPSGLQVPLGSANPERG